MAADDGYLEEARIMIKELRLAGMDPVENMMVCLKEGQIEEESVWIMRVTKDPARYHVRRGGMLGLSLVANRESPEEALADYLREQDERRVHG